MAKLILGIMAIGILVFFIYAMMCVMIVTGRSDEQASKMYLEKQICPKCKVGKESYEFDRHSETCPYIECWQDEKCPFFKPIDESQNKGILSSNT